MKLPCTKPRWFQTGKQKKYSHDTPGATNHPPNWKKAEIVQMGAKSKSKRVFLKSNLIRSYKNFNSTVRRQAHLKQARGNALTTALRLPPTASISVRFHCYP